MKTKRSGHRVRQAQAAVLWEIQERRCIHCHRLMGPYGGKGQRSATLEHFWPKRSGGSNRLENLALAHRSCNEARADRFPDQNHERGQGMIILALQEPREVERENKLETLK